MPVKNGHIAVRASARIADALREILKDANLYEGVRFWQVLEAAYKQGQKDGANTVFTQIDAKIIEAKRAVPYRKPGRPRKTSKKK
ncbi:MAG TPA: hypothetical protein VGA38_05235 [Candidatus Limnocylindria bacterium]